MIFKCDLVYKLIKIYFGIRASPRMKMKRLIYIRFLSSKISPSKMKSDDKR